MRKVIRACIRFHTKLKLSLIFAEMPHKPRDHAAMQHSVCAVCFKKHKTLRPISRNVRLQIKDKCLNEFDSDEWSWLPTVICGGCYLRLAEVVKNPRFVNNSINLVLSKPLFRSVLLFNMWTTPASSLPLVGLVQLLGLLAPAVSALLGENLEVSTLSTSRQWLSLWVDRASTHHLLSLSQ